MTHSLTSRTIALLAVTAILGLTAVILPSCKSPSSPEADTISFTITNDCGAAVHIDWDGIQLLSLDHGATGAIPSPTLGSHVIVARLQESGIAIVTASVDINNAGDYYFTVDSPATIRITNAFGEILSIAMNGGFLGDIADGLAFTLRKVRFGSYAFEARVRGDETVVATTSFKVDGVGEYSWIITR